MALRKKDTLWIGFLPEDWRKIGAEKFGCSPSKVEKVAYKQTTDNTILEWLVSEAEDGKSAATLKAMELEKRTQQLVKA